MSNAVTCTWVGESGTKYTYSIYKIGTDFIDCPGNYIFAFESSPGKWTGCYIGQTSSLKSRCENHEKEPCAVKRGATHIQVHRSSADEKIRKAEEADLIANYLPPCNTQGK